MFRPETILQRTESGRTEIYEKKKSLTQSERLVLIMIDGVSPCSDIRAKLPVLTEERLARALATLQGKDLIAEVLLPVDGELPEQLERSAVERFLQQDALDPVTIISLNPEEEFGISTPVQPTPPGNPDFSRPNTTWYATTSAFAPATQALGAAPASASAESPYSTLDRAMEELAVGSSSSPAFVEPLDFASSEPKAGWHKWVPDRQAVYLFAGFVLVFIGGFLMGRATL